MRKLRRSAARALTPVLTALLCCALAPMSPAWAQRERMVRPPARDLEGTMILSPGATELPDGYVLILEMDDALSSNHSRKSDRFSALVAKPVVDANGRTLIPEGAVVDGHVTVAEPAKWRHRSGLIGIAFDTISLDGKKIPIAGFLTAADDKDRKRIDEEGNLKAGGQARRDILFVGGGAGAGAAIGVFVGTGVLASAGIGAAVGLGATLLMKGKEAVVERGQRFGLELTRPFRIGPAWYTGGRQTELTGGPGRGGPGSVLGTGGQSPYPTQDLPLSPDELRTQPGQVRVYDVRAERGGDGFLRVFITAETPTSGWRIFTHHQNRGDAIEAWVRGTPPGTIGVKRTDHPSAPIIIVQDQNRSISRVIVHGLNGVRTYVIGSSGGGGFFGGGPTTAPPAAAPYTPPSSGPGFGGGSSAQPTRPSSGGSSGSGRLGAPADGGAIDFPYYPPPGSSQQRPQAPPSSGGTMGGPGPGPSPGFGAGAQPLASLAQRATNEIDVVRREYAGALGAYRNKDGTYDYSSAPRRPSAAEVRLLDSMGYMSQSTRGLSDGATGAQARRTYARQLREDLQASQELWLQATANPDTNRKLLTQGTDKKWQALQQTLRSLIDGANR